MRDRQKSAQRSTAPKSNAPPNWLASRPFAPQPKPEAIGQSPSSAGSESRLLEFAILNPEPGLAQPLQPKLALGGSGTAGVNPVDRDWLNPMDGMGRRPLQPKLMIGAPGDKYEQEADRVAAQVVQRLSVVNLGRSASDPTLQRETLPDEDDELQMKPLTQRQTDGAASAATTQLEQTIYTLRGHGQPLADSIRQPMEQAFGGADFSQVTIHTDARSDQLNRSIHARAFTTKNDIFFSKGAYQPDSRSGKELIAHELTHVVQQSTTQFQRSGSIQRKKRDFPYGGKDKAKANLWIRNNRYLLLGSILENVVEYNSYDLDDKQYDKQLQTLEKIQLNARIKLRSINPSSNDQQDVEQYEIINKILIGAINEHTKVVQQASQAPGKEGGWSEAWGLIEKSNESVGAVQTIQSSGEEIKNALKGVEAAAEETQKMHNEDNLPTSLAKITGLDSVIEKVGEWANKFKKWLMGKFKLGIIKEWIQKIDLLGIRNLIESYKTTKEAYNDMNALRTAKGQLEDRSDPYVYGFHKVKRRFWTSAIPDLIRNILNVFSNILGSLLAPLTAGLSAIVGQVVTVANGIWEALEKLWQNAKGLWKWIVGTQGVNREKNAFIIVSDLFSQDKNKREKARTLLLEFGLIKRDPKGIYTHTTGRELNSEVDLNPKDKPSSLVTNVAEKLKSVT